MGEGKCSDCSVLNSIYYCVLAIISSRLYVHLTSTALSSHAGTSSAGLVKFMGDIFSESRTFCAVDAVSNQSLLK